jgi:ABC-type transport system involved in cytochrome c biogenesis permease component
MTFGQELVVAGLHFTMLRVLVLFGCARIVLWMEFRSFKWHWIDTLVVLWLVSDMAVYTLRLHTTAALINRLGFAYNTIGLYFIFRVLIRDIEDIKSTCRLFAVIIFPVAISMLIEKVSGRNLFHIFGGVPQFTDIRDGALRCQGPFRHPIMAGTFGAVWMPLFVGLWWQGKGNRALALLGLFSSTVITIAAASTGPVGTFLAGIAGIGMWRMRNHMRSVRWGIAVFLVALDVIMAGHLWYIFAYMSDDRLGFQGSQGWHRSILIDAMIRHFSQWWLLGTSVADLAQWGVHAGDITNQYIGEAAEGGLITLVLFISVIVIAFSSFGRAMCAVRADSRKSHLLLWAVCCSLFAHVVNFFGVAYFDQNIVNWYLVLALAGTATSVYRLHTKLVPDWAHEARPVQSRLGAFERT